MLQQLAGQPGMVKLSESNLTMMFFAALNYKTCMACNVKFVCSMSMLTWRP